MFPLNYNQALDVTKKNLIKSLITQVLCVYKQTTGSGDSVIETSCSILAFLNRTLSCWLMGTSDLMLFRNQDPSWDKPGLSGCKWICKQERKQKAAEDNRKSGGAGAPAGK